MPWTIGKRIVADEEAGKLTVRIRLPKSFGPLGMLIAWTALCALFSYRVVPAVTSGETYPIVVLLVFLGVFGYSWLRQLYEVLRLFFGYEIITIGKGTLTFGQDLFGFGRKLSGRTAVVRNLRVTPRHVFPPPGKSQLKDLFLGTSQQARQRLKLARTGERLAFDVGKGVRRFGIQLNDEDAAALRDLLAGYL